MARHVMKMTDIGEGVVEAEVVAWLVNVGDHVAQDQHIADVMTDKATVEMSSPVTGTVVDLCGEPGIRVAVGAPLITFETGAATRVEPAVAAIPEPGKVMAPPPPPPVTQRITESAVVQPQPDAPAESASSSNFKPLASPTVRRRARELQVELADIPVTAKGGRITHEDLDRYIAEGRRPSASSPAAPSVAPVVRGGPGTRELRVIGLRRVIAEKMALSKRRIPHYSYVEEVDVTELQALLDHLNATRRENQPKLSFLPFIMKALARALREFPQCNALYDDEAGVVTQHDSVHMGVATHTPGGLMVPVVRNVVTMDPWQLATEVQRLSSAARAGKCTREEPSGSTITVTSLGKLGGLASTPVINHPEVAILGVNKANERPVIRNGAVTVRMMMNLSASFDHRIVDGYDGASLVQAVRTLLEFPATIFI